MTRALDASEPRRPSAAAARRAKLAVTAALFSAGAGAIHASVAGPHIQEYAAFGVLFVASAIAQAVWAALLLVSPSARLLIAGVVGNALIVQVWALSRTVGLPFGPEPWSAEPITYLDLTATTFELGVVAVSGLLLVQGGAHTALSGSDVRRFARSARR